MYEALLMIRRELGSDAAVLETREVGGWLAWLRGTQEIEVIASCDIQIPSRLPALTPEEEVEREASARGQVYSKDVTKAA
jgi:flagellar biosynthesis GTPase FlhF